MNTAKNIPSRDLLDYEKVMNTLNVAIVAAKSYQVTADGNGDDQAKRNAVASVTAAMVSMAYEHGKTGNKTVREAID